MAVELGSVPPPASTDEDASALSGYYQTRASKTAAADAFGLVWPALADYVQDPRTERDVADHLDLEISQARAWLRRAVDEQRLERLKRPVRYRVRDNNSQSLFDGG
ncbi:MAG: hypothetical protein M3071_09545 [Actinomycetota bacterium]|nr:hypothetical protein [Actinomycetota bacterium]